ncbi:MAG TPA: ribokinase [Clostridiaceae bacterium]|nr:ribokinase [Clostridiaceae bacterium]
MITVIGSINMDLVVTTDRAPEAGETVLGNDFQQIFGGKGANQAVAAARCGAETTLIGRVGNDSFGDTILKGLEREFGDGAAIEKIDGVPTGIAVILVDAKGQNRITVISGANHTFTEDSIEALRPVIARSRVLLLQLEIPMDAVSRSLAIAHEEGVYTILNPAPAADLPPDAYRLIDLLTPNESELSLLTGLPTGTRPQQIEAARMLHRRGVKSLIVTLGSYGSLCIDHKKNIKHVPAYSVNALDMTAAGDCFNGAVACEINHMMAEQSSGTFTPSIEELVRAIEFATKAAAISVTRMGAQPSLPYRHEIEKFDDWYVAQRTTDL